MSTTASTSLYGPMLSEPPAAETSLNPAVRFRASLLGLAIALLALAATTVVGLLVVTGPFHTALGSIA